MRDEVERFFSTEERALHYLADPFAFYGQSTHLFSAQDVKTRQQAFLDFLQSVDLHLLLAARGGVGAHEMLSHSFIDSVQVAAKGCSTPKVLCGFSDFCVLLAALSRVEELTFVHGPSLLGFREEVPLAVRKKNFNSLSALLNGGTELLAATEVDSLQNATSVEGEILGGNLSVFSSLIGSPFLAEMSGRILLLEEVGEAPHKIYRNLQHLKVSGVFDEVQAVLLGEFLNCNHPSGKEPTVQQVIERFFEKSSLPVYSTSYVGHGELNRSIPFYKKVKLSSDGLHLCSAI